MSNRQLQFCNGDCSGKAYGAQAFGGTYVQFSSNGSTVTATPIPNLNLTSFLGMWGNPVNGHLISASNSGLVDINPLTGTFTTINAALFPDGVSVSLDGSKVFIANGGTIQVVDITNGAILKTFNVGHSPDGTGVISGGQFNGFIVVNNNDGTVGLVDPNANPVNYIEAIIADFGHTR